MKNELFCWCRGDSGRFIDISMTAWAFAKAGHAATGTKPSSRSFSSLETLKKCMKKAAFPCKTHGFAWISDDLEPFTG